MKFKSITLLVLIFWCQFIFSQDLDLSILTIPAELTKTSNSVVRFDETTVELVSQKKMNYKIRKAITVLNKLGDHASSITIYHDKNRRIKSLKASAYDAFGKEMKKVSSKDFKDYSAADGFSLFNDNRLLYYEYTPISYPYTFYLEYEIESSTTAFLPRWYPFDAYNQSVQKSTYTISYPSDFKLQTAKKKFKEFKVKETLDPTKMSYEVTDLIAINYEELAPSFISIMPSLTLATNKFHLEGVDGTANNWNEFGKWMYDNLIATRMELPESTKTQIKNLVKGETDPIEKAKMVYEFVQNKTRYISIQVGIGGWMPMLASDVDRLGYGDCKGLTNYTKALMDEVGVESYYTAVYGGNEKRDLENDVYSVQGNHVILNVPTADGDLWLECTSQTNPFGYQGTFTDDRDVLVITPEGSEIKHTTAHNDKSNFQKTVAKYQISPDGSIEGSVNIQSSGTQYDAHYSLDKKNERDINEHYKSGYWSYLNNLTLDTYQFTNDRDSILFTENVGITAKDYASFSGDRMLFTMNAFNRASYVPKRYRTRNLPLEIDRGFIDTDHFEITVPSGYVIEALSDAVTIENKFGRYQFSITKTSENKLNYTRTFFLKKGTYSKEDYKTYRNFRRQIAKHDQSKIVLLKK
tara:strand:+ start:217447 stop:219357 length:1911 start_codon:yes stop_codon:yes gene_type:complete